MAVLAIEGDSDADVDKDDVADELSEEEMLALASVLRDGETEEP